MKIGDQYEVNIYGVLVVLFLVFAIGYTVLIVRQQQIISQMASAKSKADFGPPILTDSITLTASLTPQCTAHVFSIDSRQANTSNIRTLVASIMPQDGVIHADIDRHTNNINADTEFTVRGQGYLAKKKTLGENNELDFGQLIIGDVNGDAKITQKDIDAINLKIKAAKYDAKYDMNCDEILDKTDAALVAEAVGKIAD
jgi:hypothetical protein